MDCSSSNSFFPIFPLPLFRYPHDCPSLPPKDRLASSFLPHRPSSCPTSPPEPLERSSKVGTHLKSALAGGIAGCVAKTLVCPLDRVKILFQTGSPQYVQYSGTVAGVFRAMGSIWSHSGVRGLVQGHSATLLRIFPYAGIKFMTYDILHTLLMPDLAHESPGRRFMAGSLSGVTAVFVTYPLEVARVRLAVEVRRAGAEPVRLSDTLRLIYRERALRPSVWDANLFERVPLAKFYRGFAPTILGMIPYAGTSFLIWGVLQAKLSTDVPAPARTSVLVNLLCGSFAGMVAQTVSYPLEIIRRKIQVGGPMAHQTIRQTAWLVYKRNGLAGFFVGLSIGYIKVIPMTAISFVTWSKLKIRFE